MFLCFLAKIEVSLTQHLGKLVAGIERQNTCKLARKMPCVCNRFQKTAGANPNAPYPVL